MRRKPQCTTSWSSTTRTPSLRASLSRSGRAMGDHELDLPGAGVTLAELDHAAALQRLERGEAQPHPGLARVPDDAVVGHLEDERAVLVAGAHGDARRARVLVGVAHRLDEHR